jgi:hypothetical protein
VQDPLVRAVDNSEAMLVGWRKISTTIIDPEKGEQTARAGVNVISTVSRKDYCVYRMAHVGDCPLGCFDPSEFR